VDQEPPTAVGNVHRSLIMGAPYLHAQRLRIVYDYVYVVPGESAGGILGIVAGEAASLWLLCTADHAPLSEVWGASLRVE